jgi:hypothetical protein
MEAPFAAFRQNAASGHRLSKTCEPPSNIRHDEALKNPAKFMVVSGDG